MISADLMAARGERHVMDANHFDALTRSLHARRAIAPALAAVGLGLTAAALPASARKRKHKTKNTFGCTRQLSSCNVASGGNVPCPNPPAGVVGVCASTNKGKPICVTQDSQCAPCQTNADCAAVFGPAAKCIKKCPICAVGGNPPTACIVPLTGA